MGGCVRIDLSGEAELADSDLGGFLLCQFCVGDCLEFNEFVYFVLDCLDAVIRGSLDECLPE